MQNCNKNEDCIQVDGLICSKGKCQCSLDLSYDLKEKKCSN